jgi:ribosomal protein L7Ae-like RNA K-turn-binding protein
MRKTVTEESILSFIGLAARAGKVISGAQAVEDSVSRGQAFLVIVSCDSSDSTFLKVTGITELCKVRTIRFSTKYNIGHHIGKPDRAVAAIADKGFADRLDVLLSEYLSKPEQDIENNSDGCNTNNLGGVHDRK